MHWLESSSWLGAVWTDSASNFQKTTGIEFSIPAGKKYLHSLSGSSLATEKRYIKNALDRVDTPLLRSLTDELWWKNNFSKSLIRSE
jgi:hypothetical protein